MTRRTRQEIYVALLNEGIPVWRPVDAIALEDGLYQIVSENPDPTDEQWEFSTGDTVRCVPKSFGNSAGLVAVERVRRPSG